jgi:ATP-binding cassette subfamily B protein
MSFAQNIAVGNIDEMNNRALIEQSAEKSLASYLQKNCPINMTRHWPPL